MHSNNGSYCLLCEVTHAEGGDVPSAGVQVGVNLGKVGYLEKIAEATADIDIQILFCNAGYMLTGFFENTCGEPSSTYSKSQMHAMCLTSHQSIICMSYA